MSTSLYSIDLINPDLTKLKLGEEIDTYYYQILESLEKTEKNILSSAKKYPKWHVHKNKEMLNIIRKFKIGSKIKVLCETVKCKTDSGNGSFKNYYFLTSNIEQVIDTYDIEMELKTHYDLHKKYTGDEQFRKKLVGFEVKIITIIELKYIIGGKFCRMHTNWKINKTCRKQFGKIYKKNKYLDYHFGTHSFFKLPETSMMYVG